MESRGARFFDEDVIKLDRWSDDLEQGLEREIKDLDKGIRDVRKVPAPPASLNNTLEAQKEMKALQPTCDKKRRELFDAQGSIDEQRDGLIGKIEEQLKQRQTQQSIFFVKWTIR